MFELNTKLKLKKVTKCMVNVDDLDDFVDSIQKGGMLATILSLDNELMGEDDLLDDEEYTVAIFRLNV